MELLQLLPSVRVFYKVDEGRKELITHEMPC